MNTDHERRDRAISDWRATSATSADSERPSTAAIRCAMSMEAPVRRCRTRMAPAAVKRESAPACAASRIRALHRSPAAVA